MSCVASLGRFFLVQTLKGSYLRQTHLKQALFAPVNLNLAPAATRSLSFAASTSNDHAVLEDIKLNLDSDNVVRSPSPDLELPKEHIFEYMWRRATQEFPDRIALECSVTDRTYTFKEGKELCLRVSKLIDELGLKRGDVIAIFLPNCPEFAFFLGGSTVSGLIVTTVNPAYTVAEVTRQLKSSGAKAVVTMGEELTQKILQAKLNLQEEALRVISVDAHNHSKEVLSYTQLLASIKENDGSSTPIGLSAQFDPQEEVAVIPYSSGTTGSPKGVLLTHANLVTGARLIVDGHGFQYKLPPTDTFQSRTICVLPFFHLFGLGVVLMTCLHAGEKTVTLPTFDPKTFIQALVKYRPTFIAAAPPLVNFMAAHPMVTSDHLSSLRYMTCGAAPLGKAVLKDLEKKAPGLMVADGYGMTETAPSLIVTPVGWSKEGSSGVVLPNTKVRVVDVETGKNLGPGQRGEICAQGPQVMKGYLNNEEATKTTIVDGWIHTGDLGYFDEQGFFFIVDRLKELIKVKGFQVPPAELEDLLRSHPLVADVAVIGIPDERLGEAPRAFIVRQTNGLTEQMVHDFVNSEVAEYKRLVGGVEFRESIPKSSAGKILRRELKQEFVEKM